MDGGNLEVFRGGFGSPSKLDAISGDMRWEERDGRFFKILFFAQRSGEDVVQ